MNAEAYSEIFKSKALVRSKKLGSNIASEVIQMGYRMKDYQIAMDAVAACSDVREYLTAPIKAKILEGTYQVDASDFADRLIKKVSETM